MIQDSILCSFNDLARRDPLAALVASPERRATIGEVDALARAAGTVLRELPLPEGAVVGLSAPNGPGFLASLLALRRAGCAALLLDAKTPPSENLRIVETLGAAALLRCRTGWPDGPGAWHLSATPSPEPLHLPRIAAVKLTSGSTGAPRGIATPAEALVADDAALAVTMGLKDDDRLLATIPMSHSYGLSSLVMPALMRGTLLIAPDEGLFDPLAAAARTGATVFPTVPAVLNALLRLAEPQPCPESLRLVLTAGAPLSPVTASRFREVFGRPVHVFYGASECGGICYDREGTAGERGTVGTPVEGVRIVLEPAEEAGVLVVHSAAVAAGYVPEPDDRLGNGRFVAGDLAAWQNGELVLRGRTDDLVNVKGKKVNPREVEAVVARIPGVREVAVVGVPLPGGSGELLRAIVACAPGGLTAAEVMAWCRSRLAPHKVPRSVVLVPELPRTSRGKLDRAQLAAIQGAEA